jgi:hypothetical protein
VILHTFEGGVDSVLLCRDLVADELPLAAIGGCRIIIFYCTRAISYVWSRSCNGIVIAVCL